MTIENADQLEVGTIYNIQGTWRLAQRVRLILIDNLDRGTFRPVGTDGQATDEPYAVALDHVFAAGIVVADEQAPENRNEKADGAGDDHGLEIGHAYSLEGYATPMRLVSVMNLSTGTRVRIRGIGSEKGPGHAGGVMSLESFKHLADLDDLTPIIPDRPGPDPERWRRCSRCAEELPDGSLDPVIAQAIERGCCSSACLVFRLDRIALERQRRQLEILGSLLETVNAMRDEVGKDPIGWDGPEIPAPPCDDLPLAPDAPPSYVASAGGPIAEDTGADQIRLRVEYGGAVLDVEVPPAWVALVRAATEVTQRWADGSNCEMALRARLRSALDGAHSDATPTDVECPDAVIAGEDQIAQQNKLAEDLVEAIAEALGVDHPIARWPRAIAAARRTLGLM